MGLTVFSVQTVGIFKGIIFAFSDMIQLTFEFQSVSERPGFS